jgi:hypothetical protein
MTEIRPARAADALRLAGQHKLQALHITGPQHVVQVPDGDPAGPPYVVILYVGEMEYAYAAADFALRAISLGAVGTVLTTVFPAP